MGEPAQKRLIRKLDLERFLSKVKPHPSPKASLEQYTVSEAVAATMLYVAAYANDDIVGKTVVDLGCGTGRLALAAAYLGAQNVVGVDIDKTAIKLANETTEEAGLKANVQWVVGDIDTITGRFDTVLQNPPFGVQKRSADRRFLEKAMEVGNVVYSLHNHPYTDKQLLSRLKPNTGLLQVEPLPFISRFVEEHGCKIEATYALPLTIPHMFDFHTKTKQKIIIDLYVIRKKE
jgi:putative methylase